MVVNFKNDAGVTREVKVGFSWTGFLFGGIPFFFRGMPIHGVAWLVLGVVTFGLTNLILGFLINKQTANYYLEHGYKPTGEGWDAAAAKWNLKLPQAA